MASIACKAHRRVASKPCLPSVMLAVSDDELRRVLRMLFEEAGYDVVEASSGLTTFSLLLQSRVPLVVLLDRYLRGTDATEKLLTLAESGPLARHRFLLLTADNLQRLPRALRQQVTSLAMPVLTMPFEFDDMLHEVAHAQLQLR